MTAANESFADDFGEEVTYTPKGGEGQTITAILGPIKGDYYDESGGSAKVKVRQIEIEISDIAEPAMGDVVTAGGVNWEVFEPADIDCGIAVLQTRTDEAISKHHESHKKRLST